MTTPKIILNADNEVSFFKPTLGCGLEFTGEICIAYGDDDCIWVGIGGCANYDVDDYHEQVIIDDITVHNFSSDEIILPDELATMIEQYIYDNQHLFVNVQEIFA